jgi:hypothetical protein
MAAPTKFQILVDAGGGTTSTQTINIPTSGTNPGSTGDVQSLAQAVSARGFWDSTGSNFFPSHVILKITLA